jgi:hypothetical protein
MYNCMEYPITENFSGACPTCRFLIPALTEVSAIYFEEGSVRCSNCGFAIDLWKAVLDRVVHLGDFTMLSLSGLGPRLTRLKFRVPANKTAELDLTKNGIPEGATILLVTYTPNDNSLPIELHGNTPPRRFRGTKINLYGLQARTSAGVPYEEKIAGDNVSVLVLWAPIESSDAPWLYLVDAIEAVTLRRFSQAIVPAHAAAEISITPIVRSFLMKYSARVDVERFLRQDLSFASVLNVVIPLVCALIEAKTLPNEIRSNLNALRKLRNEFVHDGLLPTAVDANHVRRLLCAAVFGCEYGKYLRRFLN